MTQYLISFGAHAMDHIPGEDMPAVAKAAHAVVQEAINAGVLVCTGGLEDQRASIVTTDGTVTGGPYPEAIGGLTVVEVPSREEALEWAARTVKRRSGLPVLCRAYGRADLGALALRCVLSDPSPRAAANGQPAIQIPAAVIDGPGRGAGPG